MPSHLLQVLTLSQKRHAARGGTAAWGKSVQSCGLACEQFVLLGPVQRQVKFRQPGRGELDGLPAVQDRLDQFRAQEGETNETANVAPGNASRLANTWSDLARPVASS